MWVKSLSSGATYQVLAEFDKFYWLLSGTMLNTGMKYSYIPVPMYCVEWRNKESGEVVFAKMMEDIVGISCDGDEYIVIRRD